MYAYMNGQQHVGVQTRLVYGRYVVGLHRDCLRGHMFVVLVISKTAIARAGAAETMS